MSMEPKLARRNPTMKELHDKLLQSARRFDWEMAAFAQSLKDAPTDNAKARIITGMDVPTIVQQAHGEFDV